MPCPCRGPLKRPAVLRDPVTMAEIEDVPKRKTFSHLTRQAAIRTVQNTRRNAPTRRRERLPGFLSGSPSVLRKKL